MLSEYQLQITKDNISFGKNKRPIRNLGNKRKYKLHYENFKFNLHLGLQLKNKFVEY